MAADVILQRMLSNDRDSKEMVYCRNSLVELISSNAVYAESLSVCHRRPLINDRNLYLSSVFDAYLCSHDFIYVSISKADDLFIDSSSCHFFLMALFHKSIQNFTIVSNLVLKFRTVEIRMRRQDLIRFNNGIVLL